MELIGTYALEHSDMVSYKESEVFLIASELTFITTNMENAN